MDATTERLVDYAMGVEFETLPASTVAACRQRLMDTLGCVAGAYDHPLSVSVRTLAGRYSMDPPATILGSGQQTAPEMAAFANGVMLRFMDLSDMYRLKSGGHPSDIIAAVLAASEIGRRDGRSLITAIALGYEVYCSFCDGIDINSDGWDQPVYGVVASALTAGWLIGLDREQMGHAVALAITPNMAMYQTRQGELSAWKGCAAANASRNGVFAALLAQSDVTGPFEPIEGKDGLWDAVGRFDWPLVPGDAPDRITRTHLKCFPICYHGQTAVWTALGLRDRTPADRIAEIRINTYNTAKRVMGSDPSRWAPETHETADHSLPYVVGLALLDGEIGDASFRPERLYDPRMKALMAITTVDEDSALTAIYPESSPSDIAVRLTDGSEIRHALRYPKGHALAPMSDSEVTDKFIGLFGGYRSREDAGAVIDLVARLDDMADIGELFAAFARDNDA